MLIVGILTPPFFGMMTHFAGVNRKSRVLLLAGTAADNQYERLKSLSIPELAVATGQKEEGDLLIETGLERYFPESDGEERNTDPLDLMINDKEGDAFFSCFAARDLQSLISLSGNGSLQIFLVREGGGISLRMTDADGNSAETHWNTTAGFHEFHLYTQQMSEDRRIDIYLDHSLTGEWKVTVYEPPFRYGRVFLHRGEEVFSADRQGESLDFDRGSFHVVKSEDKASALFSLQIKVYDGTTDRDPVSVRQGIIRAPY